MTFYKTQMVIEFGSHDVTNWTSCCYFFRKIVMHIVHLPNGTCITSCTLLCLVGFSLFYITDLFLFCVLKSVILE